MKPRFLSTVVVAVLSILLTASLARATAIFDPGFASLIHQSTENYHAGGGTSVTGCSGSGCPTSNFSFGTPSGSILWEVQEKVFYDSQNNVTRFVYTIFNDLYVDPITSFHVDNGQVLGFASSAPPNWAFSQTANQWSWETNDPAFGIGTTTSLNTMIVDIYGNIGVTFSDTFIDFLIPITDTFDIAYPGFRRVDDARADWRASHPVPEPASLLLLGSGLTALGFFARRRRSKK